MPEASLRKDICLSQNNTIQNELPATLDTAVKEICSLTKADGAAIAARDSHGLRCLASTGNAPPVDSRLQTESRFTRECLETGRVIRCADAEMDSRIDPSVAQVLHLRSALAVPICKEESVLGLIEVFSGQPFAFDAADVDRLEHIAHSLGIVLAPGPVQNEGATIPSPIVETTRPETSPFPEELPGDSPSTPPSPIDCQVDGPTTIAPGSATPRITRFLQFARKLTARACLMLAAGLGLLVFLFLFVRSRPGLVQTSSDPSSVWASPRAIGREDRMAPGEDNIKDPVETQSYKMAHSSLNPGAARLTTPSSKVVDKSAKSKRLRLKEDTVLVFASPNAAAQTTRNPTEILSPVLRSPVIGHAKFMPLELPIEPTGAAIAAGAPAIPPLIKASGISAPDFVLDRTLKSHSSWVTGIAFSSDGQRLASGSWDKTVKLWDLSTGQERTIASKMGEVQTVAFSRDGRWLAAEDSSNTVTLWDGVTGRQDRSLQSGRPLGLPGTNWVYSMTFSPDGRWLASAVDDQTIRLWDVNTGQRVRDLTALRRSVMYTAFSPDGRWLASGVDDRSIGIWDVSTGEMVRKLSGHKKSVYAVAFSPAGWLLASASADKSIKLWDFATGREVRTLIGHGDSVTSLSFSPDGRWLASGSWDRTIKVWDVETGREMQTLEGHDRAVYSVAFDSRGRWLASGSEDGTVKLWRFSGTGDHWIAKQIGQ